METADNLHHVDHIYAMLNQGANIVYVPTDLHESDWEYWHWEAICDLILDYCDPDQMRENVANNRKLTAEEIQAIEQNADELVAVLEHTLLPAAEATGVRTVPKHNNAYINVWATTCSHGNTLGCQWSDYDDGVGWNYVSESSTNRQDDRGDLPHTNQISFQASVGADSTPNVLSQYVYISSKFFLPNDSTSYQ